MAAIREGAGGIKGGKIMAAVAWVLKCLPIKIGLGNRGLRPRTGDQRVRMKPRYGAI